MTCVPEGLLGLFSWVNVICIQNLECSWEEKPLRWETVGPCGEGAGTCTSAVPLTRSSVLLVLPSAEEEGKLQPRLACLSQISKHGAANCYTPENWEGLYHSFMSLSAAPGRGDCKLIPWAGGQAVVRENLFWSWLPLAQQSYTPNPPPIASAFSKPCSVVVPQRPQTSSVQSSVILLAGGIWQCLGMFVAVTANGRSCWHLVGRGQGCCNAQEHLLQEKMPRSTVSLVLRLGTPALDGYPWALADWGELDFAGTLALGLIQKIPSK